MARPSKGGRVPVLVVLEGAQKNRRFPLKKEENIIGRDPTSEVPVEDSKVSRAHSKVLFSNSTDADQIPDCRLFDLGSTNGTYLNGQEVLDEDGMWLQDRDRIQVGDTVFGYFLIAEETVVLP